MVYRHLIQLGEGSETSAEASECAGAQGQFWTMREALYAQQNRVYQQGAADAKTYTALAQELGLDSAQFEQCVAERRFQEQVARDAAAAQAEGVTARPVFDINGTRLIGAQPFSRFQQLIDAAP